MCSCVLWQGFPDVAEMLGNMAAHSEQHYRLSPAYVHALLGTTPGSALESFGHGYTSLSMTRTATQLATWRQGSVKWFAKVRHLCVGPSARGVLAAGECMRFRGVSEPWRCDVAVPQVVERFEANREIIATAVNFLDRYVQSQLSTGELSNRQVASSTRVCCPVGNTAYGHRLPARAYD
jgi:hypothetical protein